MAESLKKRLAKRSVRAGTLEGYRAGMGGQKIRSGGKGRGLGYGQGSGPRGIPVGDR